MTYGLKVWPEVYRGLSRSTLNLIAIVGCFHRHLIAMRDSGVCGDRLNNHPVSIAFIGKLNALCRLTNSREIAALIAIDRIENGESVEYEVIPI